MLFVALLLAALIGAATATVLAVRGLRAVFRKNERLRAAALLAGAATVGVYAWGLLHLGHAVLGAEDGGAGSFPIAPCREAGPQWSSQVDGYDVSYLPLRFECHLSGGGAYVTSAVPGYVTPTTIILGLIAATCGALATRTAERTRPSVP
ncbi:hypothetical protein ACGFIW_11830 [Micromonospora sp. NPDC048935]|uniref:hypothetical protein n=1 Tax=Micromonospora sp. NPDC048935 TaxID=3364262 RepID=UPI003714D78C